MTARPTAAQRKRQWEKWRGFAMGIAAAVCGIALVWALFGPAAVWLAHHDLGTARGSVLETALQNARSAYLTLAAGILAAGALVYTARNHRLSQEGQVTDRYTKAIEQLGSDKPSVRIGGIFALERIALDSARDHPTVMEVLCAFLREQPASSRPGGSLALFLSRQPTSPEDGTPAAQEATLPDMPQDVRAAITVIARRYTYRDGFRDGQGLDLEGAHLVRANLENALLTNANLSKTVLRDANMSVTNLNGANLNGADLRSADLRGAALRGAHLSGANLRDADLITADLESATLDGADLRGVCLFFANLNNAKLRGANLHGAMLHGANLDGADLYGARLHGSDQPTASVFSWPDDTALGKADLNGAFWDSSSVPPTGWQRGSDGRLLPASEAGTCPGDPDEPPPSAPF